MLCGSTTKSFFDSNFGILLREFNVFNMNPNRFLSPHDDHDASVTSVIARSTACVWQGMSFKSISNSISEIMNQKKRKVDINALYVDSRNDFTKNVINGRINIEKDDHYSVIEEPGSNFLGFFGIKQNKNKKNTDMSKAQIIRDKITIFLNSNSMSLENLKAIRCDGTPLNTGPKGGIMYQLETQLKRSVQWIICIIHCSELPLKHLISKTDGATKSPNQLIGPIGKKLSSCENLKVVKFETIPFRYELSNISSIRHKLSSDQQYLYDICCAISNGFCNQNLAKRSPCGDN